MSVMAGSMAKMYGAATMVGKDEMNGRINPALEADDDLPIADAQRNNSQRMDASGGVGGPMGPQAAHYQQQHSQYQQHPQQQQFSTGSSMPSGQGHTAF